MFILLCKDFSLEEHEYFVVRVVPIFNIWVEKISKEKKSNTKQKRNKLTFEFLLDVFFFSFFAKFSQRNITKQYLKRGSKVRKNKERDFHLYKGQEVGGVE